jgi:hypothetical protein
MNNILQEVSWEYFKSLPHGTKIKVRINGHTECDGAISVDKEYKFFVCTNTTEGNNTEDKLGFKYSWQVTESNITCLLIYVLTEELYSIY